MGLNTYPYNTFPASTDKLDEAHNEQIQAEIDQVKNDVTTLYNEVNGDATVYPYADVITINDAIPANVADCSVKIEPVQDLHGYDHPWVGGAGKNLLGLPYESTSQTSAGITSVINDDGSVRFYGTPTGDYYFNFKSVNVPISVSAGTYTMSCLENIPTNVAIRSNGKALNVLIHSVTFIFAEETDMAPYIHIPTIVGAVDFTVKLQIEKGSTATSWEPYTNICPITGHTEASVQVVDGAEIPTVTKTYTIALGDTIYGGTVDFDSGVMTVDREYLYVDGSDTSILMTVSGQLQIAISSASTTNTDHYHPVGDLVCNCFKEIYNNSSSENGVYYRANGSHNLLVRGYGYTAETTLSDWVQWLSNEPLQIVYGLATPTTIQLTPQQIQLLKGQNTLTASTGQISVTVNGVSGAIGAVQEQVNATDEAVAELAEKLPTAPTTDGAYVLTVTVADGTPAYSWKVQNNY